MALAINRSREDSQMLRMLAKQVVPKQRGLSVNVGRLPMSSLEDLNRATATILKKATPGKLGLAEALDISPLIESRRRVLETQDLERRLSALVV